MDKNSKIFVAGHKGMVGSAIVRKLSSEGYHNIVTVNKSGVDLRNQEAVETWFNYNRPEYVFLAAAKVGGIVGNSTYPAEFIYDNLQIQNNVIHNSYKCSVKKLLFLGSSCIYPKYAEQPIKEEYLLSGKLEESNEAYAIAKIAGLKMCQFYHKQYGSNFISCMPTNLYGEYDNFHPTNSHVIPGLIHRFIEARKNRFPSVSCWGSGSAMREFLYVDDLADACILLMKKYDNCNETINVGTGTDITIKDLVNMIATLVGYYGYIDWDKSKPDGTPRKVLNIDKIKSLGWEPKHTLKEGLLKSIIWYVTNKL